MKIIVNDDKFQFATPRQTPVCMKEFSEESGKETGGHMTSMGRPRKKDQKRE